jgi:hypothetical protein
MKWGVAIQCGNVYFSLVVLHERSEWEQKKKKKKIRLRHERSPAFVLQQIIVTTHSYVVDEAISF